MSEAAAELPQWPAVFTAPAELLAWLHTEHRTCTDPVVQRHLLSLRWLVLAELDRTAPEPPPKTHISALS